MAIPAIVQVSVAAFILVSWAVLMAISARLFLNSRSAIIELGVGPELFVLHLNRFTYRINLVPAFVGEVRVRVGKLQWCGLVVATVAGLLSLALLPLSAAIMLSPTGVGLPAIQTANGSLQLTAVALIENADPGKPADKAGLGRGRLILRVNDRPISDGSELADEAGTPGSTMQLDTTSTGAPSTVQRVALAVPRMRPTDVGLHYVCYPSSGKPAPTGVIRVTWAFVLEGLRTAWRAWLDARLLNRLDRISFSPDARLPIFLLNAVAAIVAFVFLYATYACVATLLQPSAFPFVLVLFSLARPGHWPLAIVVLIGRALIKGSFDDRLSIWISVICFWIFHVYSVYAGLYTGFLMKLAMLNRLPVKWSL